MRTAGFGTSLAAYGSRADVTEALQTSKHILQECEAFAHLRHIIFGQAFPDDMNSITDKMLSDFIIQSNFKWFPLDDEPEHDPG